MDEASRGVEESAEGEEEVEDGRWEMGDGWGGSGLELRTSNFELPTLNSLPDKVRAEEGNAPAVVVLFIDGPLRAKPADKQQPVAGQDAKREEQRTSL